METLEILAGDDAGCVVSAEVMRERWEAGHRDDDPVGVMPMPWYERKPEDCREEFFDALALAFRRSVDLGNAPVSPSVVNFAAHLFGARTGLANARWLLKRYVGLDCRQRVQPERLAAFLNRRGCRFPPSPA